MPHLVRGSEREEKEVKKGDADWLRGVLSLSTAWLTNWLQSKEPLWAHSGGRQSDPRACLSPGGKWCPWYAASSRMHRQTGRLPAGPLFFFLPLSRNAQPHFTEGKITWLAPSQGPACPSTTYLFNSVPLPLPLHALTPTVCQLQHTHTLEWTHTLWIPE